MRVLQPKAERDCLSYFAGPASDYPKVLAKDAEAPESGECSRLEWILKMRRHPRQSAFPQVEVFTESFSNCAKEHPL